MLSYKRFSGAALLLAVAATVTLAACAGGGQGSSATASESLAAATYVPVGEWDKYYAFLSGGPSGAVFIYGLPSGRFIRSIPVFEPRAGYGYANVPGTPSYEMLAASGPMWGDTHHPIPSDTGGDYDGRWLWIRPSGKADIEAIKALLSTKRQPKPRTS